MVMAGALAMEWVSRIQADEAVMDMAEPAAALMAIAGLDSPTEGQLADAEGGAEHKGGGS